MTIQDMHYDLSIKLNKLDSAQYRNLRIPEKDWALNEAQELFVKIVAEPRFRNKFGIEINQRIIDDVRTIVVKDDCSAVVNNIGVLPEDYWHYLSAYVLMTKNTCSEVKAKLHIRQHDDEFENSPFDKSSFEWRTVNGVFYENGIKLYDDGTFTINTFCLNYIKKLSYIHYAAGYTGGQYRLPSGTLLNGTQDCELPEGTHREIVDIAVLLITGQIQIPDYELKLNKLKLDHLN